jgi:uncharacterized repeat protein (TIGR03803 family)
LGANGDGVNPYAALVDNNGMLYSTTSIGGVNSNTGTIFSINPDGSQYKNNYSFGANSVGAIPFASLLNMNGILYGTTSVGGANDMVVTIRRFILLAPVRLMA